MTAQPDRPLDGWQLVPREPTQEIRDAVRKFISAATDWSLSYNSCAELYRAALAAAPPPVAQALPAGMLAEVREVLEVLLDASRAEYGNCQMNTAAAALLAKLPAQEAETQESRDYDNEGVYIGPSYAAIKRSQTPSAAPPAPDGDAVERAARALVPFAYGAFEDQLCDENGNRLFPPGTPREHARKAARAALNAARQGIDEATVRQCIEELEAESDDRRWQGDIFGATNFHTAADRLRALLKEPRP